MDLYAVGRIIRMSFDDSYTQEDMDADIKKLKQEHKELIDDETGEIKNISEMINVYTLEGCG